MVLVAGLFLIANAARVLAYPAWLPAAVASGT